MIRLLPLKLRLRLRKIDWLARFYRKYIIKLADDNVAGSDANNYFKTSTQNTFFLSLLPKVTQGVKISIITPVYKPNLGHFKAMVESVIGQSYGNWELILVDDCSNDFELTQLLNTYSQHPQIKVHKREVNGHISVASNDALNLASGEYIALLDHDDLLHRYALNTVALFIKNEPLANILYSDEDKVNEQGEFEQAHFKPKFSPDLLYSHNYICHLGVYKKELLNTIGGFTKGVEGSQDYDLLLRAIKACNTKEIVHIPYVLYHWRIAAGSTALAGSEKNYTHDAGLKALQCYFSDNAAITVETGLLSNTYKVNWPIPKHQPLVSIIIPTKNSAKLVKQCIDSLYTLTRYTNFEVLLVDNQSDDPQSISYFKQLESAKKVRLLTYNKPFNYSAINNYAVSKANGEVIVLMNNDIEIQSPNWLNEMLSHALRNDVGCVGAKLYYPNNTIQHAGVVTGIGGVAGHAHKYLPKEHAGYFKRLKITQNFSAVTAACLAVRKSVFEQVGGLNEQHLTIAFNDVDFCLKVQQAGYLNVWTPYAEMIHHESVSRGAEDTPEKIKRFDQEVSYMKNTWGEQLKNDPCYSPWLSQTREDFSLK
ncbi:glycosyltransferase family 2 protein [Pseudoalteromonas distincta]|uniref:glycosyltransferase family 2 protein n=1 Tax=Pseudoalteromonas distincta TaxID=77608 RepID=UPI00165FA488|nr:glycosyltransferase family 2 protein [Pseudoalteromonas distincta]MBD0412879.1 glycosyltransferase family 2 protein [Pseudoalteromonas distincta]